MARIIGAVATSHTPTIGFAYDWRALIQYGASFFMLELEQFQKTRNAPSALYSVAGRDAGNLAWDAAPAVKP
jgi:gallate dioxygenase